MFNDLYDHISLLFSRRWPKAEAVITAAHQDSDGRGIGLFVEYEFSVGNDGPYTGESPWLQDSVYIGQLIGRKVVVRYRKDDPSVNELDQ